MSHNNSMVKILELRSIGTPPKEKIEFYKEIIRTLPRILNKSYQIKAVVRKNGIFASRSSIRRLINDVNVDFLYKKISRYEDLSLNDKIRLAFLAPIIVEELFRKLVDYVGNVSDALTIIGSYPPFYLTLKEKENYLKLWNLKNLKLNRKIVEKKREIAINYRKKVMNILKEKLNPRTFDEVLKLATIISLLSYAYEMKNKIRL